MARAPELPKSPRRFRHWPWALVGAVLALPLLALSDESRRAAGAGILWALIAAFGTWLVVYAIWSRRAALEFNALIHAANEAHQRGDFAEMRRQHEAILRDHRWPRGIRRFAAHNVAWAALRCSEPWVAIEQLAKLEQERMPGMKGGVWVLAAGGLAQAHALAGELDAAEAWIAETERRCDPANAAQRAHAGTDFARAIVACRRGDHAGAVRAVDEARDRLEKNLPKASLRLPRAVRALALSSSGDPSRKPFLDGDLASLREAAPGELDFLGAQWPEMRELLAQHGLAGSAEKPARSSP